jgi:hypothetical protein
VVTGDEERRNDGEEHCEIGRRRDAMECSTETMVFVFFPWNGIKTEPMELLPHFSSYFYLEVQINIETTD